MCSISAIICIEIEIDSAYLDNVVCDVYSGGTKVFSMSVCTEGAGLVHYNNVYFDVSYRDLPPNSPEAGRHD